MVCKRQEKERRKERTHTLKYERERRACMPSHAGEELMRYTHILKRRETDTQIREGARLRQRDRSGVQG